MANDLLNFYTLLLLLSAQSHSIFDHRLSLILIKWRLNFLKILFRLKTAFKYRKRDLCNRRKSGKFLLRIQGLLIELRFVV